MYKSMAADTYILERIDDQCNYYNKSAIRYKSLHLFMRRTAVVGAATVPILTNMPFKILGDYSSAPARSMEADAAFMLLVDRCESRIAMENSATLSIVSSATQHPDAAPPAGRKAEALRTES